MKKYKQEARRVGEIFFDNNSRGGRIGARLRLQRSC
jgi:hypothetical protein